MADNSQIQPRPPVSATRWPGGNARFTEANAWRKVGAGWQRVFGSFKGLGYSIEWHEFYAREEFDWAATFHPGCVELCLNLNGCGYVEGAGRREDFSPGNAGFYRRLEAPLAGKRAAGQRHSFLTVEYSGPFLARHLAGSETKLHPIIRAAMEGNPVHLGPAATSRLTADQQQIVGTLRQPPVHEAAQPIWYQCKAMELALTFFFQPLPEEELFCTRQHRLAQERVEQVIFLLKKDLAEPPDLEELGKKIGCSPFYLSRTFSSHTGQTITQYLRRLRMDKAAALLRLGELNVTEVAMEVGYSSPSHFSQTFHESFGCCPGLYPINTVVRPPLSTKPARTPK
ncbi:MAG: Regulatory protein SoxS [Pedosphaera sp.]|nr:Regulatory protein SoxS [Pedosphaera sp.]